jgi:predicted TIM-barrel fold metal-dependent hydrolase
MLRATADAAERAGMDRRRFLQTAGGVAATLTVLNATACSRGPSVHRSAPTATGPGGTFTVPAPEDLPACEHALGGNGEFIFDVHTHHVMPDRPWVHNAPATVGLVNGMLPGTCDAADTLECVNRASYLHDLFVASDTTVALLSDVPNSGPATAPIPFADGVGTQQFAAQLAHGGAARVLVHNVIAPNFGDLRANLDDMEASAATGHVAGFKVYTAWGPGGQGFSLTDPKIGLPVIQQAHDLGVRVFTAHKGLPLLAFDAANNGPEDMVAASRLFPDMDFVIFHGAWDPDHREGPYDPASSLGIDTLIAALDRHGVAANSNVWVDLGTVWRSVLTDPDQAAHALGKLLAHVGTKRVLWGTDAIWYGSPQAQIMAMRAFQISPEYQQRFGYPALTDDVKADVFGLNAARLFGLDPTATRCGLASDPITTVRPTAAEWQTDGYLPSPWTPHGPTTRRSMLRWLSASTTRWTPW